MNSIMIEFTDNRQREMEAPYTLMCRKWYERFHKEKLPKEIAYFKIYGGGWGVAPEFVPVTWDEILAERKERQIDELECKRAVSGPVWKPCIIWTFFNTDFPFCGWWLYIKTNKEVYAIGFRNSGRLPEEEIKSKCMKLYPCGELPIIDNFDIWIEKFTNEHKTSFKKRLEGMTTAWCLIDFGEVIDIAKEKGR